MKAKFKVGDVVCLKTAYNYQMVVNEIFDDDFIAGPRCVCVWHSEDGLPQQSLYSEKVLDSVKAGG